MATNCKVDPKWDDEEEDEALSLSDLQLDSIDHHQHPPDKQEPEEFDFGSACASVLTDQEMCSADQVFFKGQILPLRLSFSHDSRSISRSSSSAAFTSRSSSVSSTTSNSASKPYKPKLRNQFHAHPSPDPQIRAPSARPANPTRKWSIWDIFRVGLVHTPEIELEDLKVRASNYHNKKLDSNREGLSKSSGFLRGCKCFVETVALNSSVKVRSNSARWSISSSESARHATAMERLEQELKTKKKKTVKQAVSRHRTFEWLKELSHDTTSISHHHHLPKTIIP